MIRKVKKQHSKEEVMGLLEPLIRDWFQSKFKTLTEPQSYAVPLIHARRNVLIESPTGSGKTLTAFLSIINELYNLQLKGRLEDKIYCVYVSPLKALANDINRNLTQPLMEMEALAREKGMEPPVIRVAVRSGDTSAQERQKQARRPPHIFITTPESLTIILSTPKFREKFADVRYVIVDEIHEVCSSKRGALLSASIERLRDQVGRDFTRIGLSATIAPIEEVAKFLAGYDDGKLRSMDIVEVESRKSLDLAVMCPVDDMTSLPIEIVNARMYDLLSDLIDNHRTTLIFTNTRSGTEHVSFKLKERGVEDLEAHHGSLSKFTRLDVEEKLKNGQLKAAVSSTSLELGIDIGYIDLVCQIGSPKSIAKGLQRIGRAGHAYGQTAKGRMIVFDNDDLVECAALAKNAYSNSIDRVDIPRNCLDVLAQTIVGMSMEKRWEVEEALKVIRRSYSFHALSKRDLLAVLKYLSSRNPDIRIYAKIWYDEEEERFGRKKGTRMIYYTNVGTIPEEGTYHVFSDRGLPLGELSEKFVEFLKPSDIFVLGGKTYQFVRARGMTLYVKDAAGRKPTVPSWTGEMLPRSFDLSLEVGKFRREIVERIDEEGIDATLEWLQREYRVDKGSANSIISYVQEQRAVIPHLPTDKQVLIEGYIDVKGNRNIIFHYCFGRRTNDALSRAYAHVLAEKLKCNVRVGVTDDDFMLTVPKRVSLREIEKVVTSGTLEQILRRALRNTELFKQRFRHCATRSFMVLRNYRGHEVSVGRQQLRSQKVLDFLHTVEEFPVIKEAYNEILNEVMDLRHAEEVLRRIETGEITVKKSDFSNLPSPFAHNVVLLGISDIVLMEDRSALLRELHREVLKKVVPLERMERFQFTEEEIREYFSKKVPRVVKKEDMLDLLGRVGALNLVQQKGRSIFDYSDAPHQEVRRWASELIADDIVQSVWTSKGILYALKEEVPLYASVYSRKSRLSPQEESVLRLLHDRPLTLKIILKELRVDSNVVLESLRKLERSYMVHRKGVEEITYHAREVERESFEVALDSLITRLLEFKGPTTAQELAYELDLEAERIEETLRGLENESLVASGHFVLGEDYQYMLSRDLTRLQKRDEGRKLVDERAVKTYRMKKQLSPKESIEDYFSFFLDAGTVFDVFSHVRNFSFDEWLKMRSKGEILEGRFLGGKVRYVLAKDAPLLLSAYEREKLDEFEEEVLRVIKGGKGVDVATIAVHLKTDRERVKEAVDKLDRNVYVIRKFDGQDGWTSRNLYVPFEPAHQVSRAREKLIERFLGACGPLPFAAIKDYTRFRWEEAETVIENMEKEGKIQRVVVAGTHEEEMYILSNELKELEATEPESTSDRIRIFSPLDPWVQPLWAQIASHWGEGWFYLAVKEGEVIGILELWEMSGCIEIREIDLIDSNDLPGVLGAIDRVMGYYSQRGVDTVRITRALQKDIGEFEDLRSFIEAGFHNFGDFVAKGRLVPLVFEKIELFTLTFRRQGIDPAFRFADVIDAAKALGGLRSDFAARLRCRNFTPLEKLHRRGLLWKGQIIPEYQSYCTWDDLKLFKRAKAVPLTAEMSEVLRIVEAEQPITRTRLLHLSPLSFGATSSALRKLCTSLYLTKDFQNRYRVVPDLAIPVSGARREVLRRIVESLGAFTAESLAAYTRFEYNMSETRALLREFEDEGWLVKGFFAKGERALYWMVKDCIERLRGEAFTGEFVLTPMDNLFTFLRSEAQQKFGVGSSYLVFKGAEMIGAFKARRKGSEILITEFRGEAKAWRIVEAFEIANEITVDEDIKRVSDEEVQEWYDKMYRHIAS